MKDSNILNDLNFEENIERELKLANVFIKISAQDPRKFRKNTQFDIAFGHVQKAESILKKEFVKDTKNIEELYYLANRAINISSAYNELNKFVFSMSHEQQKKLLNQLIIDCDRLGKESYTYLISAIGIFNKILEMQEQENNIDIHRMLGKCHLGLLKDPCAFLDQNRLSYLIEVLKHCDKLIKLKTDDIEANKDKAEVLLMLSDEDFIQNNLSNSNLIYEDKPTTQRYFDDLLNNSNILQDVLDCCNNILKINPDHKEAKAFLEVALSRTKEKDSENRHPSQQIQDYNQPSTMHGHSKDPQKHKILSNNLENKFQEFKVPKPQPYRGSLEKRSAIEKWSTNLKHSKERKLNSSAQGI